MEQFWAPIAYVLSAYILLDKTYTIIKARLHPATSLPKRIKTLEDQLKVCSEEKIDIVESLGEFERINKLQCKAMLDIMRHMKDGNHVDNMNKTIREIEDILVEI